MLICFWLPAPSNDAFFYDGPAVHLLEGGAYCNPAIRLALPISGTEVFSAYPPLYQGVLCGWMAGFGTSALSAMGLHLVLFGAYLLAVAGVLWCLGVTGRAATLGLLFLLGITFHDRPDSLAHVCGMWAVYGWCRAALGPSPQGGFWAWLAAGGCVLSLGTGLQIGALYLLVLVLGWAALGMRRPQALPWGPVLMATVLPGLLVALVMLGAPRWWQGFLEHANQTPSLTGFRFPAVQDVLKMVRNVPGILLVGVMMAARPGSWWPALAAGQAGAVLLVAATAAALAMIGGSLFLLTPNALTFTLYLQPVIVALWLLWAGANSRVWSRAQSAAFLAAALLVSIRAIGLTTWGVALALDFGYPEARRTIRSELQERPADSPVVLSSAYLYEAYRQGEFAAVHSDWLRPGDRELVNIESDWLGVLALRPSRVLLTPFDYYRRYEALVRRLEAHPELVTSRVTIHGTRPPPDSFPKLRRVVQHLSWAPVVIQLEWKEGGAGGSGPLPGR